MSGLNGLFPSSSTQNSGPAVLTVPQQSTPTSTSIPAYSDSPDKNLIGTCRLTNSTDGTIQGFYSNPFQCTKLVAASSVKGNGGATAAAVVFALLFAGTAALLAFVWWRGRKINSAEGTSYALKENPEQGPPTEISTLQHQLSLERRRVTDLQAALLSQSSQSTGAGWTNAQPKDDREVKRSFVAVFNEIKDFAGNYYRASSGSSAPSKRISLREIDGELKDILDECVSGWDKMLGEQKGRMLLVRIIVGEVLRRAWVDGEFMGRKVGKAVNVVEREVTRNANIQQSHLWRLQTLTPLLATMDSTSKRKNVVSITEHTLALLEPFNPPSQSSSPAAKKFLENIVNRMSGLYFSLANQNAYYEITPYYSLSEEANPEAPATYEHATCDDVEQKFDTGLDARGKEWSAAEGREVRGFVFPAVIKHGDGRGGGWEEGVVVVYKAQVIL
ncbi:hypothetical protein TWF694_004507 [Orbilia ellipsospora]|uniref:Uncharacterized protein n=1 Tax=Orbilia ellipsospora TaxID=2528407 RepID=A0AAV9WVF8_9PEZI